MWVSLEGLKTSVRWGLGNKAHISALAPVPERRRRGHATSADPHVTYTHVNIKRCLNHVQSDSHRASAWIPETSGTSFLLTKESQDSFFTCFVHFHSFTFTSDFVYFHIIYSPSYRTIYFFSCVVIFSHESFFFTHDHIFIHLLSQVSFIRFHYFQIIYFQWWLSHMNNFFPHVIRPCSRHHGFTTVPRNNVLKCASLCEMKMNVGFFVTVITSSVQQN